MSLWKQYYTRVNLMRVLDWNIIKWKLWFLRTRRHSVGVVLHCTRFSPRLHICHQDLFAKCTENFLIFRKCCKSLLIFEGGLQTVGVVTEHKQQSHWGRGGLWSRRSYHATNRSCFHSESCLLPKPAWFYKCTSHEKKIWHVLFEDEANVLKPAAPPLNSTLYFCITSN